MYTYDKGLSNQSLLIWIADPAQFDGRGKTGLNAASVSLRYKRGGSGVDTPVTLVALGSPTDAYLANGFIEVDATNWRGWYRWDPPNALFGVAADAINDVYVMVSGASAADTPIKISLTEPLFVNGGKADGNIKSINDTNIVGNGTSPKFGV